MSKINVVQVKFGLRDMEAEDLLQSNRIGRNITDSVCNEIPCVDSMRSSISEDSCVYSLPGCSLTT